MLTMSATTACIRGSLFDFEEPLSIPGSAEAEVDGRSLPGQSAADLVAEVQAVVDAVPAALTPLADTVALLARLRRAGRPLYFLSNMPAPYAEHLERTHGFLRCFESGVVSARVRQIKPEPGIYDTAARWFGAAPADLLFIDDVADNVHAARAAGWQALQFIDAADCEAQLRARGHL